MARQHFQRARREGCSPQGYCVNKCRLYHKLMSNRQGCLEYRYSIDIRKQRSRTLVPLYIPVQNYSILALQATCLWFRCRRARMSRQKSNSNRIKAVELGKRRVSCSVDSRAVLVAFHKSTLQYGPLPCALPSLDSYVFLHNAFCCNG
jgi:hypothetical protein